MTQTVVTFFMSEAREARVPRTDGLPGKLLGRFLPGLSYRVTAKNKSFVEAWMEEGVAHIGGPPGSMASLGFTGTVRAAVKAVKED